MADVLNSFIDKKKAESPFISLGDGESIDVKLKEVKMFSKAGFNGDLVDVLRLIVDVNTSEGVKQKTFDNGTARFANALRDAKIGVGSSFTLTRHGLQTQTRYDITNVKNVETSAPEAQAKGS